MAARPGMANTDGMAGNDGFGSERDFMDGLRVLKARSGLSYRDIAARMSRADPRHAMARSTLASLLAGNSLPRRPGQVAALVEVLSAELDEPSQTPGYLQAWSRLVAARGEAGLPAVAGPAQPGPAQPGPAQPGPTQPAPLVQRPPATRPAAGVPLRSSAPLGTAATTPPESPFSGRQVGALLFWLTLLTVIAYVIWVTLPNGVLPFWPVWLATVGPLALAGLINLLARNAGQHRAGLSDMPAEYLRTEYRDSRPAAAAGSTLTGLWPR